MERGTSFGQDWAPTPVDRFGIWLSSRRIERALVLAASAAAGSLAHLESSNPVNIPFYERLGFVASDAYRCGGDDGPLMTIMARPPAPR